MSSSPASPDARSPEPIAVADASAPPTQAGGSTLIGALMAMSAAIMWGTNGVISRFLFQRAITPLTLVEARSIIAALGMGGLLLCVAWAREAKPRMRAPGGSPRARRSRARMREPGFPQGLPRAAARKRPPPQAWSRFRVRRRDVPLLLLFGVALAIVTYAYFLSVQFLPVAVAVMIQYTGPTLIALYTALALRRMPPARIWAALALTLGGIALLAGLADLLGGTVAQGVTLLGVLIAFASAVAMAFYMLVGERLGKRLHPQSSVFYGFAMAALLWLILQPPWRFQTAALAPDALPLVLMVGVVGTLVPFGLFLAAVNRLDATRAAILATLEPVTAALISWVWLGERLDAWQLLGGLLVLVGVTIVQLKR